MIVTNKCRTGRWAHQFNVTYWEIKITLYIYIYTHTHIYIQIYIYICIEYDLHVVIFICRAILASGNNSLTVIPNFVKSFGCFVTQHRHRQRNTAACVKIHVVIIELLYFFLEKEKWAKNTYVINFCVFAPSKPTQWSFIEFYWTWYEKETAS